MQFEVHKSNYHTLLLLGLEYQMFLATISAAYLSKSKICHFLRAKKVQSKKNKTICNTQEKRQRFTQIESHNIA